MLRTNSTTSIWICELSGKPDYLKAAGVGRNIKNGAAARPERRVPVVSVRIFRRISYQATGKTERDIEFFIRFVRHRKPYSLVA